MADLLPAPRQAGVPLKDAGGLPVKAAHKLPAGSQLLVAKKNEEDQYQQLAVKSSISPSLAAILRPQAAYRWLLPYLASITPQYIESVLRGALAGNHVQQWELFDLMIDTDPEISSCVQEYVEGVLNHKVILEPYHEEDDEPTPLALEKCALVGAALKAMSPDPANDENDLYATVRDIVFARFFGNSIMEIDWGKTYGSAELNIKKGMPGVKGPVLCPRSTYWVHPVCYAYSIMGRLGLRMSLSREDFPGMRDTSTGKLFQGQLPKMQMEGTYPTGWSWITSQPRPDDLVDFPDKKFLIATFKSKAGSALGGSCFRPLAFWWCCSNFASDYIMNYAQLFGIPFRSAKYAPSTSEEVKAEIRQMLQSCGSAGYMMMPDSAELEFIEANGGAGQSPQAFLAQYADSQKRKVILHQTMTGGAHDAMGKGGGKAFGSVEQDTKTACIGAGCRFVESVLNLQMIPYILRMNYPEDGADLQMPTCRLQADEVGGLADAQRDQVLVTMMDIPDSYLHKKYRVPKPGAGDKIAGQDVGTLAVQQQQAQDKMDNDQANVEADRKQADKHAKMNADALAKQPKIAPPGAQQQPGQQQKQPDGENGGLESRRAEELKKFLQAKEAAGSAGKGCLMAMVPPDDVDKIVDFARKCSAELGSLAGDGVEVEPHVTALYGFDIGTDTSIIAEYLRGRGPVECVLGTVSRFECPDYDVLKVDVQSPDLERLHKDLSEKFKENITPSEHEYHPHLTLAYVKKGSNKGSDGSGMLQGIRYKVDTLLYSEPGETARAVVALQAARRVPIKFESGEVEQVGAALREAVAPMLARIDAIAKVKDKDTRVKLMKKFLADHPTVLNAMLHDGSLAKAMAPAVVRQFVAGLQKGGKK